MNNFLDIATPYINLGLKVFPVKYRGKAPLVATGFKAATTDLNQIKKWNKEFSLCNIGLLTGKESGIFIVDIDGEEGFHSLKILEEQYGILKAPTVLTGKGKHLYFKYPENTIIKSSVGKIAPHIDIRAKDGYIVAPPSVHENGNQYHWENVSPNDLTFPDAPDWLLKILTGTKATPKDILALLEDIANAPEGKRNDTLFKNSILIQKILNKRGLTMEEIKDNIKFEALKNGLPSKEIERVIINAQKRQGDLHTFSDLDMGILRENLPTAPKMDLSIFGEKLKEWIEDTANLCDTPVDYPAFSLLAGAAGIIGLSRGLYIRMNWIEYPCFFMGIVGQPGVGKSPSTVAVRNILLKIQEQRQKEYEKALRQWIGQNELAKHNKKEWEKSIRNGSQGKDCSLPENAQNPQKLPTYRFIFGDSTQEILVNYMANNNRGGIAFHDELATWLANMGRYNSGNTSAEKNFWLQAYSGKFYMVDRVKYTQPITIQNLLISLFGTIQPTTLFNAFSNNCGEGLISRFIWAYPAAIPPTPPNHLKKEKDNTVVEKSFDKLNSLINPYTEEKHDGSILKFTDDALMLFENWVYQLKVKVYNMDPNIEENLIYFLNKGPGTVARLSLTLQLLQWSVSDEEEPTHIGVEMLKNAISFYETYLTPMAIRTYAYTGLSKNELWAKSLAKWIIDKQPTEFPLRDVYHSGQVRTVDRKFKAEYATNILIKNGWLISEERREGSSPGRMAKWLIVNPLVYESL